MTRVVVATAVGVLVGVAIEGARLYLAVERARKRKGAEQAEREAVERAIRAQGRGQTTWEVFRPGMPCFYRSTVQDSGWGLLGAADVVEVNGVVAYGKTEGERDDVSH